MTHPFRIAGRIVQFAAIVACAPVVLSAQSSKPVTGGLSAGVSLPTGDLGVSLGAGFNVALHVYGGPANPETHIKVRGNLDYDKWTGDVVNGKVTGRSIGGSVDGMYYIGSRDKTMRPYVDVGAGLYNYKTSVTVNNTDVEQQSGTTRPALQGGVGVEFNLAGFSTMLEAKVINVFGQKSTARWIPITFGVHF